MLLKYSQAEKRTRPNGNKQQRATGAMKLNVGLPGPRVGRKVMRGIATKRTALGQQRPIAVRTSERTAVDPCDNSNDSGLGFDHHLELQLAARSTVRFADQEASWANDHIEVKRKKLEIKLEADEANDNFGFPENMNRRGRQVDEPQRIQESVVRNLTRQQNMPTRPIASQSTGAATSRNGRTQLQIISQPETQHRARYQTEGSRGAVKDRTGNGFPMVKLTNYNKPAVLSVYIGTDVGKVQPHMFYQACRVSGKNSTPCTERKETGTIYIDVEFDPAKDYVITCDCVGILKERNVDVEHRFPHADQGRHKKKSTRCRMVFRTMIEHDDNTTELLQITSHPIVCTQPPGIPEICKKSLSSSPCTGGLELFILGKNFLKDTRVMFQQTDADTPWEESVQPDKEFLQQTHLVCVVPPYRRTDISESVTVRLVVMSSGKSSEPHTFTYTPALSPEGTHPCVTMVPSATPHGVFPRSPLVLSDITTARSAKNSPKKSPYLPIDATQSAIEGDSQRLMMWPAPSLIPAVETCKPESKELDRIMSGKMMPPPPLLPISARRVSSNVRLIIPEPESSALKTELKEDGNSQSPEDVKGIDLRLKPVATVNPMGSSADLVSTQAPTLATFQRFVSGNNSAPLPTQSGPSVEKYLSNLEHVPDPNVVTKSASDHVAPTCKIDSVAQTLFAQPMIYGSQAVECKPRFNPDEAPLMQQARRKSMYEENLSSDPVLGQTVSSMIDPLSTSSPLLMYTGTERARQVPSETDKLDALVNSAAASHMSSPIPVKKMTLDPPSYDLLCTPLGVEANATYSSHDRTSPIAIKSILNGTAEGQILVSSPTHVDSLSHGSTSPIAVKTILNGTTGESQIIVTSPSLSHGSTSPIVGKNILNITGENQTFVQSPTRIDTLSHESRSPSAGKKMVESTHENGMLVTNTTGRMDRIAMKSILNSEVPSLIGAPQELSSDRSSLNSLVQEGVLATVPQATSTESACLSKLSQSALNQQQTLLTSSAHVSAESSRLNALVQSTLNSQQDSVLASASSDRSSQLTTLAQSALNQQQTLLASSAQVSAESARLNALVQSTLSSQQESVLGSGSSECARLNTLAQTALNQQQSLLASGAQVSAESARLNALVQSTLSSQPESVLAPASPESARLNSLAQSALNQQQSLLASGAQVSVESARLNALVQSTLSTQQESVLVSGSAESARLNMAQSALNQQQNLLASSAQVSVESARLNALVQSTLNSQQEDVLSSVAQVSSGESACVNTLAQSGLSQQQQQTLLASSAHVSPESARLNALVQSTLNSQQENVLVCGVQTTSSESSTLNSLVQSSFSGQQESVLVCVAQTTSSANNGHLNTLAQSGFGQQQTLLTSSAHVSAESARLNALVQSTLNSQQDNVLAQASSSNSARLNALLQDSMLGPGTQASGSQGNSGAQSQPTSEALLSTMFSGSQNASSQFTNKQDNRTGFVMQMQQKQEKVQSGPATGQPPQKKNEEGMVPPELAQMSENDLLSYINPSTFDQGF